MGGQVEEETYWAVDKSYVLSHCPFFQSVHLKLLYASDSLEVILSHLSTEAMAVITDKNRRQNLRYLLEFLAAWEKRPECLTSMAYQWCSAISKAREQERMPVTQPRPSQDQPGCRKNPTRNITYYNLF